MRELTHDLLQMVRLMGFLERDQVCCGSVTVPQCVVLQELLHSDHKVTDLAGFVGLSPSATTRLLDSLESKGWVERIQAEGDRRKVFIRLTSEGQAEAERLQGLTEAGVAQILSYIPEDKRETVIDAIALLRGAVAKALEQGISCCGPAAE